MFHVKAPFIWAPQVPGSQFPGAYQSPWQGGEDSAALRGGREGQQLQDPDTAGGGHIHQGQGGQHAGTVQQGQEAFNQNNVDELHE